MRRALACAVVAGAVAFVLPSAASGRSESDAVAMVNASRKSAGLAPLARSSVLDGLAARHNADMAAARAIYHNPALPSQLTATGVAWTVVGENVGVGPSVGHVHHGYMSSSSHRRNVLHREFNAVGIAVQTAAGRVYVTQVFAALRAPVPARRSPACAMLIAEDGSRVPASFYGLPC